MIKRLVISVILGVVALFVAPLAFGGEFLDMVSIISGAVIFLVVFLLLGRHGKNKGMMPSNLPAQYENMQRRALLMRAR